MDGISHRAEYGLNSSMLYSLCSRIRVCLLAILIVAAPVVSQAGHCTCECCQSGKQTQSTHKSCCHAEAKACSCCCQANHGCASHLTTSKSGCCGSESHRGLVLSSCACSSTADQPFVPTDNRSTVVKPDLSVTALFLNALPAASLNGSESSLSIDNLHADARPPARVLYCTWII